MRSDAGRDGAEMDNAEDHDNLDTRESIRRSQGERALARWGNHAFIYGRSSPDIKPFSTVFSILVLS